MAQPGTDMQGLVEAWKERFRREEEERSRAETEARVAADLCARELADRYGARRVRLIGSLARAGRFHERSDIDLVVEGLPEERYWEALAMVADIAGRDVDLIRSEDAKASLLERATKEGILLHGPL